MRIIVTLSVALGLTGVAVAQEQKTQIKKVPIEYTNPGSGPEMFRAYCAPCHGDSGKGTGPAAAALKKQPADLTLLSKNNNGKFPTLKVQGFIRGDVSPLAHGSRDMPMWGDIFRNVSAGQAVVDLRVRNLSDFIQGLQEK